MPKVKDITGKILIIPGKNFDIDIIREELKKHIELDDDNNDLLYWYKSFRLTTN